MPTAIQRRRGTTSQHSSFTGLVGELTIDTDKETVIVHDGSQAGGFPLARATSNQALEIGTIKITGGSPGTGKHLISDADGDASWSAFTSGDLVGPGSATDNAIARFDTTTGKLVQNSGATISDAGTLTATAFAGPITGAVTGNVTGNVSGTAATVTGAAQTAITSVGTLTSFRSTGIDDNADALAITIDSSENTAFGVATPRTRVTVEGAVTLKEQAAADADTAAYGQLWVKNTAPNTLYYTDDAGTDFEIGSPATGDITSVVAGTGLSGGATSGAATLNVDAAQTQITSLGTIAAFRSTGIDDNADALAITIDSSERVGIGTTPAVVGGGKLHIDGPSANVGLGPHVQITTADDDYPALQIFTWSHDSISLRFDAYFDGAQRSSDAGSNFAIEKNSDLLRFQYDSGIAAGSALTWNDGFVLNTSGKVGIGTTAPADKLSVTGDGSISGSVAIGKTGPTALLDILGGSGSDVGINIKSSGGAGNGARLTTNAGDDGQLYLAQSTGTPIVLLVGDATTNSYINSQKLGIGTASPLGTRVHIWGSGTQHVASGSDGTRELIVEGPNLPLTNSMGNISVVANDAQAANMGGQIAFMGKTTDSDNKIQAHAIIKGAKENSTSANLASYLAMSTRAHGAGNSEKLRITSAGLVGIGTAVPSQTLHVIGSFLQEKSENAVIVNKLLNTSTGGSAGSMFQLFMNSSSSGGDLQIGFDVSGVFAYRFGIDRSDGNKLKFDTSATLGGSERWSVDGSGNMANAGYIKADGSVSMKEQAAANSDVAAYGQVWVKTATPNQLWFTDDAGTDTQVAKLDATQTFTKAQIPSTETATISTTKTLDFDTYQNFVLTLGSGANTLANPTTEASNVGQTGTIIFIQPSSSSAGTVSLASDYESVGGSGITLSSTNSQYDVVPYMIKAVNSVLIGSPQLNFA